MLQLLILTALDRMELPGIYQSSRLLLAMPPASSSKHQQVIVAVFNDRGSKTAGEQ